MALKLVTFINRGLNFPTQRKGKIKKRGGVFNVRMRERERERGTRFQSQPHSGGQKQPKDVFWRVNDNFN